MKKRITTFYVETLVMIIVFIGVILVLTRVFGGARVQSSQARMLTNSVCLAQNAAEAFSASHSRDELKDILNQNGNADIDGSKVFALYDENMNPDPCGEIVVLIDWQPDDDGTFISGSIKVVRQGTLEELYALDTALFLNEEDS